MSANNQLVIGKHKEIYRISNVDVDGCGGFFIDDVSYTTLEDAIRAANKYMEDPNNEVEYRLEINP